MKNHIFKITIALLFLTSCVIKSPKYTSFSNVMTLEPGMTRAEVEKILGIKPYDIKAKTDSGCVLVYVYRLKDRRTLSFNTKPINGRATDGKYAPIALSYSKDSILLKMESCSLSENNLSSISKVDFEKIIMFLTVTVPVILIYLGLKSK